MKALPEIYAELQEYMGRRLTPSEMDYIFICRLTGNHAYADKFLCKNWNDARRTEGVHGAHDASWHDDNGRFDKQGDVRYLATLSVNGIKWNTVKEAVANHHTGILIVPQAKPPAICCAQFAEQSRYRIWMTIEDAESVLQKMLANRSLAFAVEETISLTEDQKQIINKVTRI